MVYYIFMSRKETRKVRGGRQYYVVFNSRADIV